MFPGDIDFVKGASSHPALTLEFTDLAYDVDMGKKKPRKKILNGCSGVVKPGEMLAILGSSGAGKTSLLNMMAGRLATGSSGNCTTSGEVTVNGVRRNWASFRQQSA